MTEQPYLQPQWLISNRDFQYHAFHHVDEAQGYLQAMCPHSVPPDQIVRPEDTELVAPKCPQCLIKFGEHIATQVQKWHD